MPNGLSCCSPVSSSTSACNILKLQYVQNFAARIIINVKKYEHITPVLRKWRWLPVKENLYYWDATLTFKCKKGHAPECLTYQFIRRGHTSRCVTRNFQQLNIPLFKTVTGQKTLSYRGVPIWNNMNSRLKLCEATACFKRTLKKYLLNEFLHES